LVEPDDGFSSLGLEKGENFLVTLDDPQFLHLVLSDFGSERSPRSMLSNWKPHSVHLYSRIGTFSNLLDFGMRRLWKGFMLTALRADSKVATSGVRTFGGM